MMKEIIRQIKNGEFSKKEYFEISDDPHLLLKIIESEYKGYYHVEIIDVVNNEVLETNKPILGEFNNDNSLFYNFLKDSIEMFKEERMILKEIGD